MKHYPNVILRNIMVFSAMVYSKRAYHGRSQTSEHEESIFEVWGACPLRKFEIYRLRNALVSIFRGIFLQKSQSWVSVEFHFFIANGNKKGKYQDEATASSCLMLATALPIAPLHLTPPTICLFFPRKSANAGEAADSYKNSNVNAFNLQAAWSDVRQQLHSLDTFTSFISTLTDERN